MNKTRTGIAAATLVTALGAGVGIGMLGSPSLVHERHHRLRGKDHEAQVRRGAIHARNMADIAAILARHAPATDAGQNPDAGQ